MPDQLREKLEEYLAEPISRWKPWRLPNGYSPQEEFAKAADGTYSARLFRASNQSGKTESAAIDHIKIAAGWHLYYNKPGPTHGWIISPDWSMVGEIWNKKFRRFLPMSQVKRVDFLKRSPEIPLLVTMHNGSTIGFKSADAGRSKFQSASLAWAWIDEEIDSEVVEEVRARLIAKGGLLSVTLTPVSRKAWVLDLENEEYRGVPSTKVVRASMRDAAAAGILDARAVESYLSTLPERQRRVREHGDYASLEGMVYADFSRKTHCVHPRDNRLVTADGADAGPWPIPDSWCRFAAVDFGYSVPTAVVVIAEDPYHPRWIVERVYYASNIRMTRWIPELQKVLPRLECPMIADHDAFERAELAAAGIPTAKAKKDVIPGIESMERALMPALEGDGLPKLLFLLHDDQAFPTNWLTGRCDALPLVKELERYRYAENKDGRPDKRDAPVKRDDHASDSCRYAIHFLERRAMSGGSGHDLLLTPKVSPFAPTTPPSPWK